MYSAQSTAHTSPLTASARMQLPRDPFWQSMLPRSRALRRGRMLVVLLLAGLALALTSSAGAAMLVGSTTSCTLADAIDAANTQTSVGGCTYDEPVIELAAETFEPDSSDLPFVISSLRTITIRGSAGLVATIHRDENDPANRLFDVHGTLVLRNLTLSGGSATIGGAIYNWGTIDVRRSTFDGNSASIVGGAIYLAAGSLATIARSTFVGNSAQTGGAIYSHSGPTGSLGLENSTFFDNYARIFGGAIHQNSGYILAESCTFKNLGIDWVLSRGSSAQEAFEVRRSAIDGGCSQGIDSLGDNATNHWTCLGPGEQTAGFLLKLSDELHDHGGATSVLVPLAGSPLLDGYDCDPASDVGDQRDVFDRYPPAPTDFWALSNYGQGPVEDAYGNVQYDAAGNVRYRCDIGAYESVCPRGFDVGGGQYKMFIYGGQGSESFGEVLNNGSCTSDRVDFGGEVSNCSLSWNKYGGTFDFENIWLLPSSCVASQGGGNWCFSNPEACKNACALDSADATVLPQGFSLQQASADEYVINAPCGDWTDDQGNEERFRVVIEFVNGEIDFWDPEIVDPNA